MTHPEELLAGYVDGTLPEPERDVVDAHLEACATCREEVELARAAVTALASLPEEPVPFGVTGPILAEAGRRFDGRRAAMWSRVQWGVGAAAAAALILVVALNLGNGQREHAASPAADGAASAPVESAPAQAPSFKGVERQPDVNYDDAGVRSLATDSARGTTAEDSAATGSNPTAFAAPDEATACVKSSGGPVNDPRDTLLRLVEAEYQGTPAYFAVFIEGPGAEQPADTVVVWVVATDDCRILTLVSQHF